MDIEVVEQLGGAYVAAAGADDATSPAIVNSADTPERQEFERVVKEQGLTADPARRDAGYRP